jgi:N-acyl-D-amino-acid deacylase
MTSQAGEPPASASREAVHDLVLSGGVVVDGNGKPRYEADVGVRGGRIAAVGRDVGGAKRVIKLGGRVLCPGFIDMHAHSDLTLFSDPQATAKVSQGVTLEVLGQDGLSCAPVEDSALELVQSLIEPIDGQSATPWSWRSVAGYLGALDREVAVNIAYLVPHGTVRGVVMGLDDREASPGELERMISLVQRGMRDGAFGLSTGLTYPPSHASTTTELAALCRAIRAFGGIYATHLRDYDTLLGTATEEAITIGEDTDVPVHISHFQAPGKRNHGRVPELIAVLTAARARGIDVTFDVYPYEACSTSLVSFLPIRFQAQALGAPGHLPGPEARTTLIRELDVEGPYGIDVPWSAFWIAGGIEHLPAAGTANLAGAARLAGCTAGQLAVHLLERTAGTATVVVDAFWPDDVRACLTSPIATIGSDGILVGQRPHPRGYGTFPRVLRRYVREEGILSLEQAIHAMTGRAARQLGLGDRGVVAEGAWADLVVFDPDHIADTATYDDPRRLAHGVDLVLVNGQAVWEENDNTGALPGRSLRHTAAAARARK